MKKDDQVLPLSFKEFSKKIKICSSAQVDLKKVFEQDILDIPKYAIGTYFWFIPDNSNVSIVDSSDNIHDLTSFEKDEWKKYYPDFLSKVMHPEDWNYFLGGVGFMIKYLEKLPEAERKNYRFNIYSRIKNKQHEYRWMVVQFPKIIYNPQGKAFSSLIVVSDLSHFEIINKPIMSLIDTSNAKKPFYKAIIKKSNNRSNCAQITKREREILSLMIKGENSPQIAEKLFISYSTVENHKRNLRQKTNCKTAAELVYYVLTNNLI